MDKMIAYCGLVCTDCEAYVATQANDMAVLEQVAIKWREEFNVPELSVESILCDGCLDSKGRKCSHCFECEMRACGLERGIANCAHCAEYACDMLTGFFGFVPDARTRLDAIRAGLVA